MKTAATTLAGLRRAASGCRDCPLWADATQTVFGEGPPDASILLLGEAAGDREDLEGHPFVGPAGRLLNGALAEAGLERHRTYVTNVVKHFKFERRGKRRLHQRANAAEVRACLQWLDAELALVRPHCIVCLGALAARVVLGRAFRLREQRGQWLPIGAGRWAIATVHPSFVLRARTGADAQAVHDAFVDDLRKVRLGPPPA